MTILEYVDKHPFISFIFLALILQSIIAIFAIIFNKEKE